MAPAITENNTSLARLYTVSGRVQGVWFRDSTRRKAETLRITGYARNMPDGTVEVLAIGNAVALDALREWLSHGPPLAKVSDVKESEVEFRRLTSFEIS